MTRTGVMGKRFERRPVLLTRAGAEVKVNQPIAPLLTQNL